MWNAECRLAEKSHHKCTWAPEVGSARQSQARRSSPGCPEWRKSKKRTGQANKCETRRQQNPSIQAASCLRWAAILLQLIVMCALRSTARRREQVAKPSRGPDRPLPSRMVIAETGSKLAKDSGCSRVDLGDSTRVALMITPRGRGAFRDQAGEVLSAVRAALDKQPEPMAMTLQTVFLK